MDGMPSVAPPKVNNPAGPRRSAWIYLACFSAWLGAMGLAGMGLASLNSASPAVVRYGLGLSCLSMSLALGGTGLAIWRMKRWGPILYLLIGLVLFAADVVYRMSQWDIAHPAGVAETLIDIIGLSLLMGSFVLVVLQTWKAVRRAELSQSC